MKQTKMKKTFTCIEKKINRLKGNQKYHRIQINDIQSFSQLRRQIHMSVWPSDDLHLLFPDILLH